ncbi:MAG TPA: pyrroloquinoline quinone biosynthesis protein PqqE [Terriglobia bacterium]|nr:pyrroloquinoline quinone biosynthesis protein PqqE [Terriglobia bacterium]
MDYPAPSPAPAPVPYALVAELTHRCPLHCIYCSNALELKREAAEMATADWLRTLDEVHALGVVQLHLSGGEPLVRADLEQLVERGRKLEFYSNLITSGIGLSRERTRSLAERGLDSVQLSLQAAEAGVSDRIGGRKAFGEKQRAAEAILEAGLPLSMNVVLHRLNLNQVEQIIELCASWGAERLELANTQYYGWGLVNRDFLLPSRAQLAVARAVYEQKKVSLAGKMELIWVLPDYYQPFPKPCMGGWGQMHLTVSPDGTVLPCQAAASITSLQFESVRERSLAWIWQESAAFNRFRGFDWMPEPCRSCDRRFQDFGGCRCQALALAGDASRTDPVCQWSPDHHLVTEAVQRAQTDEAVGSAAVASVAYLKQLTYRRDPERNLGGVP